MKKDDIKTLTVVSIVCLICVIFVILFGVEKNSEKLEHLNEYNEFFTNINYINSYINYGTNKNTEAIYSLLNSKYIKENSINLDNLYDNIETYPINSSIKVKNMYYVNVKDNKIYYINGEIIESEFNETKTINNNYNILLLVDNKNNTISFYPVDESNYKNVINKIIRINIKNNNFNNYKINKFIKEQICVIYLNDYIKNISDSIDNSYNMLSDNMKKKYSLSEYKRYIKNNSNKITTVADKCFVQEGKNRTYYIIDKNGNEYTFYEDYIMNYKVQFSYK